jgi:hypothetical protein
MSTPAAIQGTFSDFRTVKGRKVAQLVIEVPVEQADAALRALGGVPQPHDPKWVAIARLDPKAASKAEEPKERKAWADLPPAQQCAIRCGEPEFLRFLTSKYEYTANESAADIVRDICGVNSRAEINTNHKARMVWFGLDTEYMQATGRLARSA